MRRPLVHSTSPGSPRPSLASIVTRKLKDNPDGPFDAELVEQFARLVREDPQAAVQLLRHYPALGVE